MGLMTRDNRAHLVQNHTRVEHKVGVKQGLELPHELIRLGAPLHLHERSHIAPRAMLTLYSTNPSMACPTDQSWLPLLEMCQFLRFFSKKVT